MEAETLEQRMEAALGVLGRVQGVRAVRMELRRVTEPGVVLAGSRGDPAPWDEMFALVSGSTSWSDATIYVAAEVALLVRQLTIYGEATIGLLIPATSPGTKSMRRSVRLALLYLDPAKQRLHAPPAKPRALPTGPRKPRKKRFPKPEDVKIPEFF